MPPFTYHIVVDLDVGGPGESVIHTFCLDRRATTVEQAIDELNLEFDFPVIQAVLLGGITLLRGWDEAEYKRQKALNAQRVAAQRIEYMIRLTHQEEEAVKQRQREEAKHVRAG